MVSTPVTAASWTVCWILFLRGLEGLKQQYDTFQLWNYSSTVDQTLHWVLQGLLILFLHHCPHHLQTSVFSPIHTCAFPPSFSFIYAHVTICLHSERHRERHSGGGTKWLVISLLPEVESEAWYLRASRLSLCVYVKHSPSCPLVLQPRLVNVNDLRNNSFVTAVKLEHTVTGSAVPNLKYGLTSTVHLRPVC